MSYYSPPMGDYKTYGYAGDPGFLSGLFGGIGRIIKGSLAHYKRKAARGLATPIGQAAVGGAAFAGGTALIPQPGAKPLPPAGTVMPGGVGIGGVPMIGGGGAMVGVCPSGYHFAKDGSGRLVRNRRMNVANPRALRRALRRTDGFVKLAKRSLKGTGYAVRRA